MTKAELIARLAGRFPQLVAKDAEFAVNLILEAMTASMAKGQRIEIRDFGSFGINYHPPRTGRNPKTGEKVPVPEKFVPHFKPGRGLRKRVDSLDSSPAQGVASLRSRTLLVGGPGSGKTILAPQFLVHGAQDCKEPDISGVSPASDRPPK